MRHEQDARGPNRPFERMNESLNQHQIHSVLDKVYSFNQAREGDKRFRGQAKLLCAP
jgi:hypothetical protein